MIRFFRLLLKAVLGIVLVTVLWVGLYRFVPPPFTFTKLGDVIAGHGVTKTWMPLSKMDFDMARAAIAGEDSRFCQHHGFDWRAIAGAAARDAKGGWMRGVSTVSQQTAKISSLFQGGGYVRKAFEAYFTVLTEAIVGQAPDHGGVSQHRRDRHRHLWL